MSEDERLDHSHDERRDRRGGVRPDPAPVQGEVARAGGHVRLLHRGDLPQDAEGSHTSSDRSLSDHGSWVSRHVTLGQGWTPCCRLLLHHHHRGCHPWHRPRGHHPPRRVRSEQSKSTQTFD